MKLILQHYLASLKERNELDAILPDLLSQLGLNVFSKPGRGTRQDGVDVGAIGKLDGETEKVYLFSIKAGDLTRRDWDGDALQSLRPSLNEIVDSYIPNKLPTQHKDKPIVICICFGGFIREEVRSQVKGYMDKRTSEQVSFEEWNGDKLAELIQDNFLHEELLSSDARSLLRKSLALIDEPEASYHHFANLLKALSTSRENKQKEVITSIRQMNICLWIHYSWAREAGNVEATYLSSELTLLHAWEATKTFWGKQTKTAKAIRQTFNSILELYLDFSFFFTEKTIIPFVSKRHALSVSVNASCGLDVNLRLFYLLGRLAIRAIWTYLTLRNVPDEDSATRKGILDQFYCYSQTIKQLVSNNPTLHLPVKDDQAIDLSLAVLVLLMGGDSDNDIKVWLNELMDRAEFAFRTNSKYPCNIQSYSELLEHPGQGDEYLKEKTVGSILYPMIALFAQLAKSTELFEKVSNIKNNHLKHCNFQLWFPDESSESQIYTNSDTHAHGAVLSNLNVDQSMEEFAEQVFGECDHSKQYMELSAVQAGFWPITLVACRHFRLPIPIHIFRDLYNEASQGQREIEDGPN